MQTLLIKHPHFTLEIEVADDKDRRGFERTFLIAFQRHWKKHFVTKYEFSSNSTECRIWQYNNRARFEQVNISKVTHPVFFENTSYKFNLDFKKDVLHPFVYSKLYNIESLFKMREITERTYTASAIINFQNQIGYFDLNINYQHKTVPHSVLFRFEVFPVKMNFKRDFPAIIKDIEVVFPRLVIDQLKKTYHNFDLQGTADSEIVWWIIFTNLFRSIIRHVEMIVKDPYKHLGTEIKHVTAGKVKKPKGRLADKLERFQGQPDKHFSVAGTKLIEDNYENRFVKFIIKDLLSSFKTIYGKVKKDSSFKRMSEEYRLQLEYAADALSALLRNPLFNKVKDFKEPKQQSAVLLSRPGYAGLIKDWESFYSGYHLLEGIYEMEFKDIAYLYQVWSFFAIADLLRRITGVSPDIIKMPTIRKQEFREVLQKDMASKMVYHCPDQTVIELYQELRYTPDFTDTDAGTLHEYVCPDIILRIGKKDQPRNLYLTYLFDAKYRLRESARYRNMDEPLPDDLEQMNNYKEVIYHRREQDGGYEYTKEVTGAYVLYPGRAQEATYRQYYEQIILQTNRGGFPLLPYNKMGMSFLEEHLRMLISIDSKIHLDNIIKPKGIDVKSTNAYVIVLPVPVSELALIAAVTDQIMAEFPWRTWQSIIGTGVIRYMAPYIHGRGIICYYEIMGIDVKPWRDIYPRSHPAYRNEGRRYMVLQLANKQMLDGYVQIKGMANNKRYTQIRQLYRPVNGMIRTLSENSIREAARDAIWTSRQKG